MQLYSKCVKMCEIGFRWYDLDIKKERLKAAEGEDVDDFELKMCDIFLLESKRKPLKNSMFSRVFWHTCRDSNPRPSA